MKTFTAMLKSYYDQLRIAPRLVAETHGLQCEAVHVFVSQSDFKTLLGFILRVNLQNILNHLHAVMLKVITDL